MSKTDNRQKLTNALAKIELLQAELESEFAAHESQQNEHLRIGSEQGRRIRALEAERDALIAENERLTAEAMFQQQMTEPEDIMFERIERAARASFRKHESNIRGQIVTRADSYESHLVWAAQAEVDAKLAAQREVLEQAFDAMAPMRGMIIFDQAMESIRKVLAAGDGGAQ